MNALEGKVAIVTGASSGIGRGIAERLARDGATVLVNYMNDEAGADATVKSIEGAGGRAVKAKADVTKVADVRGMFERCVEKFDRPHILVNNAGKGILKPLAELDEQMIDDIFGLNAKGPLLCLAQASIHLQDGGRIVNIASSTAIYPWPGAVLYGASKGAVLTMTEIAAVELGPRRINVNAVIPGITETPMTKALPPGATKPVADASPYKRLGLPSDIAAVVAFLCGPDAEWVNGQRILANGGSGH